ncbi:hypothetical protein COL05_09155 [Bacillus sp. AFS059628]|nr:hypothetical protein COL05_09155 [Bacillus sp. AFS059628]
MQKYFSLKKYGKRFKQTIVSLLAFLLVFSGIAPSAVLQTVHAETASSTKDKFSSQVPSYSFDGKNEITAFNAVGPYHLQAIGGSNVWGYDVSNDPKIKGRYIDADNDSSTISSSSMEYVPNGEVVSAFLYISPDNIKSSTDTTPTFIQGPKGGKLLFDKSIKGVYDITEFVKQEGAGHYWGKNLWLQNPLSIPWGSDALANWDIVFVEKNENLPSMMTKLNYYNDVNTTTHPDFKATLSDQPFLTKQEGSLKGSMVASVYGGNKNIDNDQYRIIAYKDNQIVNDSYMSDSARAENNFWNGSITKNGQNISTRNPDRTPANTDILNLDFTNSPYFPAGIDKIDQKFSAKPINAGGSTDLHYPHFWGVALEVIPPKLEISKNVKNNLKDKTNYEIGDTVVYSIVAKNTVGGAIAKNVIIEDEVPEGLELVEGTIKASHNAIPEYNNGKITANFGNVSDTDERIVTFEAKISNDQTGKTINNIASVKGDGLDPIDAQTKFTVDLKAPVLESKKEAGIQQKADGNKDATHPEVGDTLLYKIQTRNTVSDSSVKNAVIEDQLPAGLEYVPGTLQVDGKAVTDAEGDDNGHYIQGKVTGKLGDVTDAEWHNVTFHAKVKADQAGKSIQNKATVTGDGVPPQEPTTTVEVSTPETPTPPANSCGPMGRVALINGGFEQPPARNVGDKGSPGAEHAWMYFYEHEVPGWKTTATDKFIQIMQNSNEFLGPKMGGNGQTIPVVAAEGKQYAELNANQQSMLYQDVATTPGQTIYWRLAHRGEFGIDTMQLRIGSSNTLPNDLPVIEKISSTNNKWTYYTGSYKVPAGQTMTRFGFDAVSSSNGDLLWGNLLDDIFLGTDPCVSATKSVDKEGQVKAGDELTYKVTVKNDGGDIAANSIFTDAIPMGTEYVPGSIQVIKNGQVSTVTDGKDTDSGDYLDGKVTVNLGDLPNTDILPDGVTVQFKVKVLSSDVKQQIKNKANVAYKNLLTNTDGTVDTNEVVNDVEPEPETPTPPANSCGQLGRVALVNGSFEEPYYTSIPFHGPGYFTAPAGTVPGWKTTDSYQVFEIFNKNLMDQIKPGSIEDQGGLKNPVAHGQQFAELNSREAAQLYQDVQTTPGQTIYWRLAHKGRQGLDTMAVKIGSSIVSPKGLPTIQQITTGKDQWKYYTGTYTVPAGQTATRFGFEAISSASGYNAAGNFLDDIFLGTEPCVTATKSVSPEGEVKTGDELTYNVTVKNDGGDVASNAVFTDAIPEGTEYVPGTIKVVKDAKTTNITDETDTDSGNYQDGKVTVNLGDLPNTGILPDGVTVQFKVKVSSGYVNKKITNKAHVAYKNLLKNEDQSVDTNEVVNNVIVKEAKVESKKIAKNLQDKNTEVGDEIEYTIQMRNTISDSIVKNAVIEDQLPESLEYVPGTLQVNGKPVTDTEGDDNGHYVQGKFTGQLGNITDTEWHTVVFHAKVKAGQAGQDIQNTAKVTGENVPPQEPSTTVEVYPRNPKVESKKTAKNLQDKNIEVGDEIEYTIQMRNTVSDSIVKNAVIEDQLPEALEYVPGTLQVNGQAVTDVEGDDTGHYVQGKVTGQLGDITDTEWHTVVFHAKVKAGQEGTAIQNTAKVTGENVPPQEPTTEIKVQPLGQIEIEKVDAADSAIKLKNAVFQIIDKDGKEVGKLTTDENGKATSELLLLGKYTVKEIKAPDGYMLLKDPIEVEVSSPLHKITVENTKNGWNIPHTGGIGTTLFYLIGMIIMVAALVVFFRKRAKNK